MEITKSKLTELISEGNTVSEISTYLTDKVGIKVSESIIRSKAKEWNLDLRKKPSKNTKKVLSLFVDDTANLHKEVMGVPQLVEEVVVEKTVTPEPKGEVQVG